MEQFSLAFRDTSPAESKQIMWLCYVVIVIGHLIPSKYSPMNNTGKNCKIDKCN